MTAVAPWFAMALAGVGIAGGFDAIGTVAGTVAFAEVRARWTDPLGSVSHDQGQFSERVRKPRDGRHVGTKVVEAPA
jgi:hypothetical protein